VPFPPPPPSLLKRTGGKVEENPNLGGTKKVHMIKQTFLGLKLLLVLLIRPGLGAITKLAILSFPFNSTHDYLAGWLWHWGTTIKIK